jgi:hypothetical protein
LRTGYGGEWLDLRQTKAGEKCKMKCFICVLFSEYDEIDRMRVDAVATYGRGRGERMRGSCEVKK